MCLFFFPPKASSAELMTQNIDFYIYRIYVSVRDSQGRRCLKPHVIPVQACQCDSRNYCTSGATKIIIIGGDSHAGGSSDSERGQEGEGQGQEGGGNGHTGPEGGYTEDHTNWQTYTGDYDEGEGYTAATDDGYDGDGNSGRNLESSTTLSGAAIGLMFLGGLIFVCKYKI